MDQVRAFEVLLARVRNLQRMPLGGMTNEERDEEEALITALSAISFESMFGPPSGFILADRIPPQRQPGGR